MQFRQLFLAATAIFLLLGWNALSHISVDVLPEFNPPIVEIQAEALGLSAAEVEDLVTINLEEILAGTSWLKTIRSKSVPGLSSILLIFEPGTDLMRARQMVQERLTMAYALPNVSKPPVMLQPLSATSRTAIIGLTSDSLSLIDMSVIARWTVVPKLLGVPGVANVTIWGQRARQLQVQVEPQRLNANGVTLEQVIASAGNSLWTSPLSYIEASTSGTGGWIDTPNQRLGIQHVQPITTPSDLARVVVEGTTLQLGDVAQVVEAHPLLIGDAVVRNGAGLLLVVERFPNASAVEVMRGVDRALTELKPGMPGIKSDSTLFRATSYIESALANLRTALAIGGVLLILVLCVAFRPSPAALIAIAAIGLAPLPAVLIHDFRGEALNTMVVTGLAIALIPLIDDAITTIASVGSDKLAPATSSRAGPMIATWTEIRRPAIYATLVAALIVFPLFLLKEPSAGFYIPLAVSFLSTLAASAVVAVTSIPPLVESWLSKRPAGGARWLKRPYEVMLTRAMNFPRAAFLSIAVAAAIIVTSVSVAGWGLLPSFKERDLQVTWEAPPGTSHPEMRRMMLQQSRELSALPGIRSVAGHIGRAITGDQVVGMEFGQLWVGIDHKADYESAVAAIHAAVRGFPGLRQSVQSYLNYKVSYVLPEPAKPIVVRIEGTDRRILQQQAERIAKRLSKIDGVTDVQVDKTVEAPEVTIEVNLDAAARFGLKPGDVRRAAATVFAGLEVGNLFEQQKVFDVVVQGSEETRKSLGGLRDLLIDRPKGGQVRLSDVADVRIVGTPRSIEREGISRHIDVTARAPGRRLHSVLERVDDDLSEMTFPLEYHPELLDDFEQQSGAKAQLVIAAAAAIVLIFLLLQAYFQSWSLALAFFLAFLAAMSGGVLAAIATSGDLLLGSLAGLLAILTLAVRHGLLLASRCEAIARDGRQSDLRETILHAARQRAYPVAISLLAIAAVCLPIVVLGDVAGLEILYPMGIAVLGGLVSVALVSLIATPVLYSLLGGRRTEAGVL